MVGMVTAPVVTTLAMALPDMVAKNALERIETLAAPPLKPPRMARQKLMKKPAAPVTCRATAKIMYPMSSLQKTCVGRPKMLCIPSKLKPRMRERLYCFAMSMPGQRCANKGYTDTSRRIEARRVPPVLLTASIITAHVIKAMIFPPTGGNITHPPDRISML